MPRFFFNLNDGAGNITRDEIGVELPDLDAARQMARELAAKLQQAERELRDGRTLH